MDSNPNLTVDLTALDALLDTERADAHGVNLITVLQKTQNLYGYLPPEALEYISQQLGIKPAKVMGVATFYTQFRMKPTGQYTIQLCHGTACHVNGADEIGAAVTGLLGITDGQTTPDGLFTLINVACLGCCSLSPVMMINGEPYGLLTSESTQRILTDIQENARLAARNNNRSQADV